MKSGFILVIELMTIFLGLLSIGLLLFVNKTNRFSNRFLATHIFCLVIYMLAAALSQTDFYFQFPHFYRAFYPLYLVIYPSLYLYLRGMLLHKRKLSRYDLLHLLPAAIIAVQFIPFYKMGSPEKTAYLHKLFENASNLTLLNEGYLPAGFISVFVYTVGLAYMAAAYKIYIEIKTKSAEGNTYLKNVGSWVLFCLIANSVIPLTFFAMLLINPPMNTRFVIIISYQGCMVSGILVYLFARREILYGIDQSIGAMLKTPNQGVHIELQAVDIQQTTKNTPVVIETQMLGEVHNNHDLSHGKKILSTNVFDFSQHAQADSDENESLYTPTVDKDGRLQRATSTNLKQPESLNILNGYAKIVEQCMTEDRLFLKHGLSLRNLSEHTLIPAHHLTAVFNKIFGQRFNDYINNCRIKYITDNRLNEDWKNLTIEGIGWAAGFSSRITFFKVIKKQTGLSPSRFLEKS
ncbi:MAG: helix-turn-helix domain-containing protein [Chitinophagaceae bacterium]